MVRQRHQTYSKTWSFTDDLEAFVNRLTAEHSGTMAYRCLLCLDWITHSRSTTCSSGNAASCTAHGSQRNNKRKSGWLGAPSVAWAPGLASKDVRLSLCRRRRDTTNCIAAERLFCRFLWPERLCGRPGSPSWHRYWLSQGAHQMCTLARQELLWQSG